MSNTENTTVTYNEWVEYAKQYAVDGLPSISISAMEQLSTSPSIIGYMTNPIGVYDGVEIAAKSRKTESLEESKQYFDTCGKKIVMHSALHFPSVLVKATIDIETCKPIYLDEPVMSTEHWLLRYVEI